MIFKFLAVFNLTYLMLDSIQLQKHRFDFNIIVFSQINNLIFELIDFSILPFLSLNKDYRVIKVFLLQMILVIFSKDLDLTPKIIIRALNKLELTDLSMPFKVLPLNLAATFVVALDDFAEAPIVMRL